MKRIETILFILGCVLFLALMWNLGVGELWRQWTSLGWGIVPFIVAEGVSELIHTVAWRHCLSKNLRSVPLFYLFRVRLSGYAINYFTPTAAMGGELTKVSLLTAKGEMTEAASGVLIGKVCFAGAHILFVALGTVVIARTVHLSALVWVPLLLSGLLVASGILIFLLLQKYGKIGGFIRWLAAKKVGGQSLKRAAAILTSVDGELAAFYRDRPGDVLRALGWHLAGYSVGIVPTWIFVQSLQSDASLSIAAAIWFLGMCFDLLTFAVPLNAGSLEGSRVLLMNFLGYPAGAGMTYGIALRLGQMFWAAAGLGARATLTESQPAGGAPRQIGSPSWPPGAGEADTITAGPKRANEGNL